MVQQLSDQQPILAGLMACTQAQLKVLASFSMLGFFSYFDLDCHHLKPCPVVCSPLHTVCFQ